MVMRKNREEWKIRGNVFDKFTKELLFKIESQGFFEELGPGIKLGKEANIFTAPTKEGKWVIVKIYRLQNCNFNKMLDYLKNDSRYMNIRSGKRNMVFKWAEREYRNLLLAREHIKVPTPLKQAFNVIVMELIGHNEVVSYELKDSIPKDPDAFLKLILENIIKLWKNAKLVHGDLSAFNILNHEEKPVFIDFSQASPTNSPNAKELLRRDLTNIAVFFKKLKVKLDVEKEFEKITSEENE